MKTKIFTFLALGLLFFSVPKLQAQNLLYDGDFSLTTEISDNLYPPPYVWCKYVGWYMDVNAIVTTEDVCQYHVGNLGQYNWEVQLIQAGFKLEKGHKYRLSFDVKVDKKGDFGVFLGEFEGNWTNFIGYDRYWHTANTEWKNISLDFDVRNVYAYHKLSFEFGFLENNTIYFDNVILEDLGEIPMTIGIIGDATGGWDNDIFMKTNDRIHYTLTNYPLKTGWLRFRQDNTWGFHWGNNTFPDGIALLWGPNIPINYGNYDISFNLETGEYSFDCVSGCPPVIGIIGSAVTPYNDWKTDIKMFTTDGITYKMSNHKFTDGEAQFRQDNSWDIYWGNSDFPAGTASLKGNKIPVTAGEYSVTFNFVTGEYSFDLPSIGILGSALKGWTEDIDMQTTDGINYTLSDYTFNEGEVKFRLDNLWDSNWGALDFPTGVAYMYGPNIPVPAGTYNVTFNRKTLEYSFVATTCPVPGIQCPESIFIKIEPGMCGATVFYPDVVPTPTCGGDGVTIKQIEGLPSGSFFPADSTLNTFLLTNAEGNTATCSFYVFVYEFEPPVITLSSNQIVTLWPPNHQMVPVPLDYKVTDNCDTDIKTEIYVFSNESDDGKGDGNTSPDWVIVDEHNVLLRSERSALGNGREYYITILSHDNSWNYAKQQITIKVPHDYGKKENTEGKVNIKVKSAIIGEPDENVTFTANIWPNPSSKSFNLEVQSTSNEKVNLTIFDVTGRLISNLETTEKQYFRFGDGLAPGIYQVVVSQGKNRSNIKVIKQQ